MSPEEWVEFIRKEYLSDFIRKGGAAVKFAVVSDEAVTEQTLSALRRAATDEGFLMVSVNAAQTKIHLVDRLFFEIARQLDWEELARRCSVEMLRRNGYRLPGPDEGLSMQSLARVNERDERLLRTELNKMLESEIYQDRWMAQEFRVAAIQLCRAALEGVPHAPDAESIREWLRGEIRLMSALKQAMIFQKIGRHSARHILASLLHWLPGTGSPGLVIHLDITRYLDTPRAKIEGELSYGTVTTYDLYEVLRQFIDMTDELVHGLIVVTAPREFFTHDKRGVNKYDALRARVIDDVRDRDRANPLAPLVRLGERWQEEGV